VAALAQGYLLFQINNLQLTGICFPVFWSTRKHLNSSCKCGLSSPFVPGAEHQTAITNKPTVMCAQLLRTKITAVIYQHYDRVAVWLSGNALV